MLRKTLLVCGILSSLLYVAMTVLVAMQWEGYSSASQTISELSAIGAPTRSLWLLPAARLHRARDRLRMGRLDVGRSDSRPAHRRRLDYRLRSSWTRLAICPDAST